MRKRGSRSSVISTPVTESEAAVVAAAVVVLQALTGNLVVNRGSKQAFSLNEGTEQAASKVPPCAAAANSDATAGATAGWW